MWLTLIWLLSLPMCSVCINYWCWLCCLDLGLAICWPCWCWGGRVCDLWPPSVARSLLSWGWRTLVEWRAQFGWRKGCVCWLCGGGFAPPTQEVGCVMDVVCLLVGCIVLVSSGRSKFLGHVWGTGWLCYGCILSPPFRPTEFIKGTLPALAATSLQWTWLN